MLHMSESDHKQLEEMSKESLMIESHPTKVFHKLSEYEHLVNGFARIVLYEVHSFNMKLKKYDPLHQNHMNKIIALEEGRFDYSHLNGFGRIIDYKSQIAQIGYYKNSWPHGKLIQYRDGKLEK